MIVPTKDAPELAYVVESSPKQYVPDVIYKEKDDYGNEVIICNDRCCREKNFCKIYDDLVQLQITNKLNQNDGRLTWVGVWC